MEVFNNTFEAEFEGFTPVADGDSIVEVTLPQEWYEINEKLEEDHRISGGLVYKAMDGTIKVTPLVPAYGIREDECGVAKSALAMYNSKQQLLVKPATEGRHAVSLQQLDKFFGGVESTNERTFSIKRIPPVDTTVPISERKPYVFCRDSENRFSGKVYSEQIMGDVLVERNANGDIYVNSPTADNHPVNRGYLKNALDNYTLGKAAQEQFSELFVENVGKSWLPNYDNVWQFRTQSEFAANYANISGGSRTFEWDENVNSAVYRATGSPNWIQRYVANGFADGNIYKFAKIRYMLPKDAPQNLYQGLVWRTTTNSGNNNAPLVQDGVHTSNSNNDVKLVADGNWHDLVYDLSASSKWDGGKITLIRWANGTAFTNPIYVEQFGLFNSYEDAISAVPKKQVATVDLVKKYVDEAIKSIPNAKGVGF